MAKTKQMKFVPHPEISLLQSAVNEVIEQRAKNSEDSGADNSQTASRSAALTDDDSPAVAETISPTDEESFLNATEAYCKAAASVMGVAVKHLDDEAGNEQPENIADKIEGAVRGEIKTVANDIESDVKSIEKKIDPGAESGVKSSLELPPDAVMEKIMSEENSGDAAPDSAMPDGDVNQPVGRGEGILTPPQYCLNLAVKFAQAKFRGDSQAADGYFAEMTAKDGDCDPHFITEIGLKYAEFLIKSHLFGEKIPYKYWNSLSDFVLDDGQMKPDATIAIIGDWGTGQDAAINVLRQVAAHSPDIVIHLGDIYYSGTEYEAKNYFTKPFDDIFTTKKPLVFNMTGNHDMYSGGEAYYNLIANLNQPSSYFCLRNDNWQILAMDTSFHCLQPDDTYVDEKEVEWHKDKINNFDGKTVLLSHHQLFSANDNFQGQYYNQRLFGQFEDVLDKVDIWLWGHEHDMFIFNEFLNLKRGRCLGASAFPIGKDEMPLPRQFKWSNVLFDKNALLNIEGNFYEHSYAVMKFDGASAAVEYFTDSNPDKVLYTDNL